MLKSAEGTLRSLQESSQQEGLIVSGTPLLAVHPFPSPLTALTALTPPFFRRKTVLALYRYLRCSLQVQTNGGAKQQSQANLASMIPWTSWFQPLMRITRFPGFPVMNFAAAGRVQIGASWVRLVPGCSKRMCSKAKLQLRRSKDVLKKFHARG